MTKFSQTERLFNLLSDNAPHRTDEIVRVVYPASNYCPHCGRGDFKNLARVGARVKDLKDGKWRGKVKCIIEGWKGKAKASKFYWYRMDWPQPRAGSSIELPEAVFFKAKAIITAHSTQSITLPPAFPPKKKVENQTLF